MWLDIIGINPFEIATRDLEFNFKDYYKLLCNKKNYINIIAIIKLLLALRSVEIGVSI